MMSRKTSLFLLFLPLLYFSLSNYLSALHGPFFLTRIDPDYVYLLNGMNCSILRFDRIGHIDHPGTPFQVFLGLCIDIIYFFSGKDSIVHDVLARPEHYLFWCSNIITVAFSLLIFWAGKIGKKYAGWTGAFLLQISPFLSPIILDLSTRMMSDRFAMILVFVLMISLIKVYSNPPKSSRGEVTVGILSGIIIATKISFIPVLLIPFIMLRNRMILAITTLVGFLLGILPILNRYHEFSAFIKKLISHDGIYGSGTEQFINGAVFLQNIWLILQPNALLVTIIFMCVWYLISDLAKGKSIWKGDNLILLAFGAAAIACILLVAKHYKNYYMAPILMTMGTCLFAIYKRQSNKLVPLIIIGVAVCFSFLSISNQVMAARTKSGIVKTRLEAAEELKDLRASKNYFIIKPDWRWGLSKEYGLIFGLSYVRHRFVYQPEIDDLYPQALSYEGPDRSLRQMRLEEIADSTIISQGHPIFLVDQVGRRSREIMADLGERIRYHSVDSSNLSNGDKIYRLEPAF